MTEQTTDNITEDFSVEIIKLLERHEVTIHDTVTFLAGLMDNRLEKGILDVLATKDHALYQIRQCEDGNGQVALVRSDTLDKVFEFMKTYIKPEFHDQLNEFGDDQFGGFSTSTHLCKDNTCSGEDDGDLCENWETVTYTFTLIENWTEDDCKYDVLGSYLQPVNAYHDLTQQEIEQ